MVSLATAMPSQAAAAAAVAHTSQKARGKKRAFPVESPPSSLKRQSSSTSVSSALPSQQPTGARQRGLFLAFVDNAFSERYKVGCRLGSCADVNAESSKEEKKNSLLGPHGELQPALGTVQALSLL
jgi:hypothetical protein